MLSIEHTLQTGPLQLTKDHLLFASPTLETQFVGTLVPAGYLRVGRDSLWTGTQWSPVTMITSIVGQPFLPIPLSGRLMVNGVAAFFASDVVQDLALLEPLARLYEIDPALFLVPDFHRRFLEPAVALGYETKHLIPIKPCYMLALFEELRAISPMLFFNPVFVKTVYRLTLTRLDPECI
jgi:hypothetical protein